MPDKHEQAEEMRDDVPSTIARSDDKAVRTYKKTLESAEESYGDGERAHRAAYASLKHTIPGSATRFVIPAHCWARRLGDLAASPGRCRVARGCPRRPGLGRAWRCSTWR
ncbi:ChaB family protein [Micromonospora sp. NPDC005220]|uniref:ChaB family protein n=1 Tax=Micromonospora sp. NPDC005220 TaxID=3155589 RepID=UPI0033AB4046